MTHDELVKLIGGIHVGVLPAALFAFYKYGDRSEFVKGITEEATSTIQRIKQNISDRLRECLRPVFENVQVISVSLVLDEGGKPWDEAFVNPAGSEAYRNAIGAFVDEEVDAIADYRSLRNSYSIWMRWSKIRSWVTWLACIWQLIAATTVCFVEKFTDMQMNNKMLFWTLIPTVMAVLYFFCSAGRMMILRDHISEHTRKYQSL